MKQKFPFKLVNLGSLHSSISSGVKAYNVSASQPFLPTVLWLLLGNGMCLKIYTEMHDLDGWNEIGTLVIEAADTSLKMPEMKSVPVGWMQIISLEKLVFESDECIAECGLLVRNSMSEVFAVLPGAEVDTIAIEAPFFSGSFMPENEISRYSRLPL